MNKDKKLLFTPTELSVREATEGNEESRIIEGCAIVFNQETTLWDGKYERIREIISPSCITDEFLSEQDIKLNLLHDRDTSLCRNNKGVGTLILDIREDGLHFSAEMPKCDLGDRALELVRNKTYTGCSFEFYPGDYTESTTELPDGREDILYTHTRFEAVTALTLALDPAYQQTSVDAREAQQREIKREEEENREADEAAEQAKKEAMLRDRQRAISLMNKEIENLRNEIYN